MTDRAHLENLARLIRHSILTATTRAGSGHPTARFPYIEAATGSLGMGPGTEMCHLADVEKILPEVTVTVL